LRLIYEIVRHIFISTSSSAAVPELWTLAGRPKGEKIMKRASTSVLLGAFLLVSLETIRAGDDVAVNSSIIGTWTLVGRGRGLGSLGACELIQQNMYDLQPIEASLVISTNSIHHRYKKIEGVRVIAQRGQTTSVVKSPDGNEYVVIDYNYKVNTNTTPHQIDLSWTTDEGKSATALGIYRIYRLPNTALELSINIIGGDRPEDFDDSERADHSRSVIFALRVQEKEKATNKSVEPTPTR
jgi:hypothetical protein